MGKSIYTADQVKLQTLLRRMRRKAGLTQVELAKRLERPQNYVSKYESGERRLDIIELRQICRKLNVNLTKFVSLLGK